jgi:predicted nuclease of predicted toxin-antitoxin system
MTVWLDAHLSPRIARWLSDSFAVTAAPVRELKLRDSEDEQIFFAAREAGVVVMTKDSDFIDLLERHGSPLKIIWVTCGNTSEAALKAILSSAFPEAKRLLESGEDLVEIGNL